VRAISLHADVIVASSALLAANCVLVRGGGARAAQGECFVIDSPMLPEELDALAALVSQTGFPAPSALLATHADWDHLLGPLAFPGLALGCAESSAERLRENPGAAQRELREFDERLYVQRERPLALAQVHPLPVPGRCEIGEAELELHPAGGHTRDGMAIWIGWAGVLVAGDYLSSIEIPTLGEGGSVAGYRTTLERLRPLVAHAEHVVPGHGPTAAGHSALDVLDEDLAYLRALDERGEAAELPRGRRTREQRRLHEANVRKITPR
jgi:glyoxylase-like metal-dependent hydrolase (beta-lactamase superfamily II)